MDNAKHAPTPPHRSIAVLMGGVSREKEVSLRSGQALVAAYKRLGIPVEPMVVHAWKPVVQELIKNSIDTVVLALHGPCGEDGAVQGLMETLTIPYTGSGIAPSAICMDKSLCKRMLRDGGLPTPDWSLVQVVDGQIEQLNHRHSWANGPVFVKPNSSGSSFGVFFVDSPDNLREILVKSAQMAETNQRSVPIMVERAIEGVELTLSVFDDQPFPVIEIQPEKGFFSYDNKYTAGRTCYKIPPDRVDAGVLDKVTQLGLEAGRMLGCRGLYRVDFMVDKDRHPWILEINTTPGLTPTSLAPKAAQAVGISFDTLAARILNGARLDRCCAGY